MWDILLRDARGEDDDCFSGESSSFDCNAADVGRDADGESVAEEFIFTMTTDPS